MPLDDIDIDTESAPRADAPARPQREADRPRRRDDTDDGKPRDEAVQSDDAAEGDAKGGAQVKKGDKPKKKGPWLWIVFAVIVFGLAVGGGLWWWSTRDLQGTDDAYTDGNAVAIAPKISGYVIEMNVGDNRPVHKGDVLIRIGSREQAAQRDQARAQVMAAQGSLDAARVNAQLVRATAPAKLASARAQRESSAATLIQRAQDYRRQTSVSRAATTQQSIDEATSGQSQAKASVAQADAAIAEAAPVAQLVAQADAQAEQLQGQLDLARAQLAQAEVVLSYGTVLAPQDGTVTKRNVNLGNYVAAGGQILALVTPEVWVTANFKESELRRMRPGQDVDVRVDAYPQLRLRGRVDSVQLGTGSKFSAFPAENATGNYVKIVQRVPVKIVITDGLDPGLPLPLGLSVAPTVHLK